MDFGGSFLVAVVPVAHFWHTEAASKVSAHSDSGGRSWPQPATKAIAHPSFWAFSAGGLWDNGLRVLVFGLGCAWDIPWAHGGRSQSLGPHRVRRTKLAPSPLQGYSPPLVLGIFRWGVVGQGAFQRSFLGAALPRTSRGHTEAARKVSPHSESGGRSWPQPHTKAVAHPSFWAFSGGGGCGTGAFGRSFLGAALPRTSRGHTEAARKVSPHSESGGRSCPSHPPRL